MLPSETNLHSEYHILLSFVYSRTSLWQLCLFSIGKVSFFMGSLPSAYKYVVIAPIFREKKMYLTPHPPFTTSIVDCLYSKTFQKNCPFLLSQFLSSHFSLEPTPIMLLTLYSSETALVKVTNKLCVANSKDCISTWIF